MKNTVMKFLSNLENDYNTLPHPVYLVFYGMVVIVLLSMYLATKDPLLFTHINPNTLEVIEKTSVVTSAFSSEAFFQVILEASNNFFNYPIYPLIFIMLIGFSIAEKSGMLFAFFKKLASKFPKIFFTYSIVIFGVLSNLLSPNILNAGYIVLLPLSAFIYMGKGRNPLAGIATAFASIFAGYQLNIFYDNVYINLAEISEKAASIYAYQYKIPYYATNIFMFVATVVSIFTIVYISEKVVVPFCKNNKSHTYGEEKISPLERSGLIITIITSLILFTIYAFLLIPSTKIHGAGLLIGEYDSSKISYIQQFIKSPFVYSLAVHISIVLSLLGITFGLAAKKIKRANDIIKYMVSGFAEYAEYFVIIFFFSQLLALLKYTNMSEYILVTMVNYLETSNFEGITLIYAIITMTFVVNFFVPSSIEKWSYLAPVVIPSVMAYSFTPSLGQLAYLIGDTTGNIMTPFMPYTIFAFALFRVYGAKTKQKVGIGTALSLTLPFSLMLLLILFSLLSLWVTFILPLGDVSVFL